jgi:hypothetical protein
MQQDLNEIKSMLQRAFTATQTGDFDTARDLSQKILAQDTGNLAALHIYFDSTKIGADDPIFANLVQFCENKSLADPIRSQLFFMLGKGNGDQKQYTKAFNAFVRANKLAAKKSNPNATSALSKLLIAQVTAAKITPLPPSDTRMVFILGMPRSGTSIMAQSLASHSRIISLGENTGLGVALQSGGWTDLSMDGIADFFQDLTPERLVKIRNEYLASINVKYDAQTSILVDKMPENYWFAWLIPLIFPNAIIVHMKRPPLANCWSCFRHDFKDGHHYSYDFRTMMAQYAIYSEMTMTWQKRATENWYEMPLNDFISDPRGKLEPILDHLALPWQEACLAPENNETSVTTLSKWQVRQGLDQKISQEWENYLPFIQKVFL